MANETYPIVSGMGVFSQGRQSLGLKRSPFAKTLFKISYKAWTNRNISPPPETIGRRRELQPSRPFSRRLRRFHRRRQLRLPTAFASSPHPTNPRPLTSTIDVGIRRERRDLQSAAATSTGRRTLRHHRRSRGGSQLFDAARSDRSIEVRIG